MFLGLIYVFWLPYFDHDAFTHHALNVLDTPAKSLAYRLHNLSLKIVIFNFRTLLALCDIRDS